MERKKASDFPQELLNLFDRYVHGGISRRDFLDGAQKFAEKGGIHFFNLLPVEQAHSHTLPSASGFNPIERARDGLLPLLVKLLTLRFRQMRGPSPVHSPIGAQFVQA